MIYKNKKIPNTFGFDVKAASYADYDSVEELENLIACGCIVSPFLHIGCGSNLLFEKDYEGTVLHSRIGGVEVTAEDDERVSVRVGAGVIWDDFVACCVERGWYGAENLSLIPGEVGASAVQNIGAYGVEVKDLISSVETINIRGEKRVYQNNECEYAYRKSLFKKPEMKSVFVTYVNFALSKKERYTLDYGTIRQELANYPAVDLITQFELLLRRYPSMPHYEVDADRVKIPAGWMIDQCGWKGKALGSAAVHDKQALVLVNLGGATGRDVIALSDAVRASVQEKFGVEIKPEVNFI